MSSTSTTLLSTTMLTSTPVPSTTEDTSLFKLSSQFGNVLSWDFVFYCYAVFGPLLAFLLFGRFYMLSRMKHVQLSWQLKLNLIVWLISLFFGVFFYLTIWMRFATPLNIDSLSSELVRGSLHVASTNTLPLSTTFLLLDRILAISFLGQRLTRWRQHFQWVSILSLMLMFSSNFGILIWRTVIDPPVATKSCTFSCRMNQTIKDLLLVKLGISIGNVICGAIFIYLYMRYARSLTFKRERKFNHTTLFVFITEFMCNILPTSIYLIGNPYIEAFNVTRFTSTLVTICHDTDALATAALYWITRINTSNMVKKLIVSPLMKAQNSLSTMKQRKSMSSTTMNKKRKAKIFVIKHVDFS